MADTQKIIMLEGPDGCGKTHIAHELSREKSIPYYKLPHEKENWAKGAFLDELRFGERRQLAILQQTGQSLVIDRGYPSEWVYSQLKGRPTDMKLLKKFDHEYARLGTVIVVLLRHDYSVVKDELVSGTDLNELHELYEEFIRWTQCSVVSMYVDSFDNDPYKELPALRREILFDPYSSIVTKVTLDAIRKPISIGYFEEMVEVMG